MLFLLAALLLATALEAAAEPLATAIPAGCRQLVVATTPSWRSSQATVSRLRRGSSREPWVRIGETWPALTGECGLAWGLGLHKGKLPGPRKTEGDRRAPAGVFALCSAFGREAATLQIPYRVLTPDDMAVDDPASRFYNRIVRRSQIHEPDWESAEQMFALPDYSLGVVVSHNPDRIPGAGSCIFIHEWRGHRRGTAGCTILRLPDLRTLVEWLDPRAAPVLLQVPSVLLPPEFR